MPVPAAAPLLNTGALGYARADLQGPGVAVLLEIEESPEEAEALRQIAAGDLDRYVIDEKSFRRQNGSTLWAKIFVKPFTAADFTRHVREALER